MLSACMAHTNVLLSALRALTVCVICRWDSRTSCRSVRSWSLTSTPRPFSRAACMPATCRSSRYAPRIPEPFMAHVRQHTRSSSGHGGPSHCHRARSIHVCAHVMTCLHKSRPCSRKNSAKKIWHASPADDSPPFVQGDKYGSRPISELDVTTWDVSAHHPVPASLFLLRLSWALAPCMTVAHKSSWWPV